VFIQKSPESHRGLGQKRTGKRRSLRGKFLWFEVDKGQFPADKGGSPETGKGIESPVPLNSFENAYSVADGIDMIIMGMLNYRPCPVCGNPLSGTEEQITITNEFFSGNSTGKFGEQMLGIALGGKIAVSVKNLGHQKNILQNTGVFKQNIILNLFAGAEKINVLPEYSAAW
jgi:hypothetical protein